MTRHACGFMSAALVIRQSDAVGVQGKATEAPLPPPPPRIVTL